LLVSVLWAEAVVKTLSNDTERTRDLLDWADELAATTKSRLWGAWIHLQRAQVAFHENDFILARRWALDGADAFTDMVHRYGAAHCRMVAGQALLKMGRSAEAMASLEEASLTFSACGDFAASARISVALAEAQGLLGDSESARVHIRTAMQTLADVGDWAGRTEVRHLKRILERGAPVTWAELEDVTSGARSAIGPGQ
jgi:tetratricopeptide (TPR) repeat protein